MGDCSQPALAATTREPKTVEVKKKLKERSPSYSNIYVNNIRGTSHHILLDLFSYKSTVADAAMRKKAQKTLFFCILAKVQSSIKSYHNNMKRGPPEKHIS